MIRVEGLQELQRRLHDLPRRVAYRHLRRIAEAGAEPIRARASELAPREPGAPDLAENIGVSRVVADDELAAAVAIGPTRGFFYGLFQEFGTRHHAAQAFLRPAFDGEQDAAHEAMRQAAWQVIREEAE